MSERTIFDPITLTWEGEERTIPSGKVMRLLAKVEDIITLVELGRCLERQDLPMAKISMAYGVVLREAGFRVKDEEVYNGMFKTDELRVRAIDALTTLQVMMVPPERLRAKDAPEKPEAAPKTATG